MGDDPRCGGGRGGEALTRAGEAESGWRRTGGSSEDAVRAVDDAQPAKDGEGTERPLVFLEESEDSVHDLRIREGYEARGGGTLDAAGPASRTSPSSPFIALAHSLSRRPNAPSTTSCTNLLRRTCFPTTTASAVRCSPPSPAFSRKEIDSLLPLPPPPLSLHHQATPSTSLQIRPPRAEGSRLRQRRIGSGRFRSW